jgi:hypothetical protein
MDGVATGVGVAAGDWVDGAGAGWADLTFGTATTTTTSQPVANLVVDLFEAKSKNLLWRGLATRTSRPTLTRIRSNWMAI